MRHAVLYVSYDGVLEPLGESQVVSYLEGLAGDYAITLLSFEKPLDFRNVSRVEAMSRRLRERRIDWMPLVYHKSPPVLSTVFDALAGLARARWIARDRRVRIVHARGYVPALIALGARGASGAAFLFDMRGFWVDEKVEAKHWKAGGLLYRIGKWWERRFYRAADAVVSLTKAGARAIPELGVDMRPGAPVDVIPTCADLQRFSPGAKAPELLSRLGLQGSTVIGCVGTMRNWYMRREMLECLAQLARAIDGSKVLLVTRDDREALRRDLEAAGLPGDRLVTTEAPFAEMPRYIRLFDAGLFFIRPSFSKRASAATKLAEFLGCGVPVIINEGVGDSGDIVREAGVGVVLRSLTPEAVEQALPAIRAALADAGMSARCRRVAEDVFDLRAGIARYHALYQRLVNRP